MGKPKVDETYHWRGLGDGAGRSPSCCRVRIFYPHPEQAVIVLSDLNKGASITNSIEYIMLPIARKYGLDPRFVIWIEHYPQHRETDPEVEFSQVHPEINGNRVSIHWTPMTRQQAEDLTGAEL